MAPVTEFVLAARKPGADLEPLYKIFATTKTAAGNQGVRASQLHEDADKFALFLDWDAVESHKNYQASDAYKTFMSQVIPHSAGPATVYHVELAPFPPTVLDNAEGKGKSPVAEVLFTYFAPSADAGKNLAAAQSLVAGLTGAGFAGITGESSLGWTVEKDIEHKGEKTRALIVIIGWESVEAHQKARATEAYGKIIADFQAATEDIKGVEISHVSTKAL
ncbi:hypothetical protein F4677DRAFT_435116 [Hypoxylon crocopeplum]|nr:hypothetical protein F4677DRAFT_435116 [Hypoxylon crocopeplum]